MPIWERLLYRPRCLRVRQKDQDCDSLKFQDYATSIAVKPSQRLSRTLRGRSTSCWEKAKGHHEQEREIPTRGEEQKSKHPEIQTPQPLAPSRPIDPSNSDRLSLSFDHHLQE